MDHLTYTENIQPIVNLFLSLAEHFGLISAVAFILLSTRTLQRMISRELTVQDKLALVLFFGAFGIFGTYDGDPIQGVIANLRAISMILAGLIGGPVVGIGAGLIAGGHRFLMDMDGFSSLPCALGTFLEGTAAGMVSMRLKNKALNWRVAALLGLAGESVHMGLVLVMSQPFETAVAVVRLIGIPMIILNSIGAGCLIEMIRMVVRNRERRASIQARKAMTIANRTVIHLREGLNEASALATAGIIHEQTRVAAVAITDTRQLLAYVGIGDELYRPGQGLRTSTTSMVLKTGKPIFASGSTAVGEEVPHKMFHSAIVVPLKKSSEIIGALKFYGDKRHTLNHTDFEIANGLANLFSTQLELQDIQIKSQLLDRAEIKRLQAQINPHFLFNSLNTIASFCRTNSNRARQLLLELSNYLRRNIKDQRQYITLIDELKQIESYLAIEHARFGERIQFEMTIMPGTEDWPMPPLIVQPLVENAVKHGLSSKEEGGKVWVNATQNDGVLCIKVKDNGVGMPDHAIAQVYKDNGPDGSNASMGLRNVNQRLKHIYGASSRLRIESVKGKGTTVTINLPLAKGLTN
ncbi:MAG: LytS/YhcK type 5TM receptor domain-containing protein [Desulfobacteraceae bacterium]|jgi:two-component system sensor histidine kinase LytS